MKPDKIILLLILVFLTCGSCENEGELSFDSIEESSILGSWTNSYEEGDGVYRRSDNQTFPPSRFRQAFEFKEGFVCEYLVLAPNDAHYMQTGQWRLEAENSVVSILDIEGELLLSFQLLQVADDRMVIKITSPNLHIGG